MTAKDIQQHVIKEHLKPLLRTYGYRTPVQTWYKDKGDFFTVINLQNFSWNNKDNVDFCFNIGVALKTLMKGIAPKYNDLSGFAREGFFLPSERQEYANRNKTGYQIVSDTSLENFAHEIKMDFSHYILPSLESLNSLHDCANKFENTYFGDYLKKMAEGTL